MLVSEMMKFAYRGIVDLWATASVSRGAITPRSLEERQERADLMVTGTVMHVDVSTEGAVMSSDWVMMLQAEVEAVEKGTVKAGEPVLVDAISDRLRAIGCAGLLGGAEVEVGEIREIECRLRDGRSGVGCPPWH